MKRVIPLVFMVGAFGSLAVGVYGRLLAERAELVKKIENLEKALAEKEERAIRNGDLFLSFKALEASSMEHVADALTSYRSQNNSFVFIDLKRMELTLFEHGNATATFPVLTKGKEGSWWETPTGEYTASVKTQNHFSSIGRVWMPWSIQFYGNFFIHGWPYYEGGEPVAQTYSGGCIRLASEDAEKVFRFVSRGMPILIEENGEASEIPAALVPVAAASPVPAISAEAFLVADMSGENILLERNSAEALPVASLVKLMTGVVASELIYLDRSITIAPSMLTAAVQSFDMKPGDRFRAYDLLFPLLMRSSNGAAAALAAFTGQELFLRNMNAKAVSLGMASTHFADTSGISDENISTARDLAKLTEYIIEKRHFLFGISRGANFLQFDASPLSSIENFNEFASRPSIFGVKNGETLAAKQTMLSVWLLRDESGMARKVMVVVLGSDVRGDDTEKLLAWTKQSFSLKE